MCYILQKTQDTSDIIAQEPKTNILYILITNNILKMSHSY